MKKVLVFLSLLMLLAFVGCSRAGNQQSVTTADEPLVINWLAYNQATGLLASSESETKKLIEDKYNVTINIETVNIHDTNQWNLYWSAGNMPDYANTNKSSAETFRLLEQGVVREIPAGWLDQYMPDWMRNVYISIDKETVYKQINKDGKTYIIPYTGGVPAYTLVLRKDWLDKLGITTLPQNNAELFEVYQRFVNEDPDGNGRKDTYGIHASMGNQRFSYISSSMGIQPNSYREVDGKIVYTNTTDAYRDHLKMLRDWYAAGVVDPESFIDDRVRQRQKWAAHTIGSLGDSSWWFATSTPGNLVDMIKTTNPNADIVQLAPFPDAQGRQLRPGPFPSCAGDGSSFFTVKASDEVVRKVMEIRNDLVKDPANYIRTYFGIEGRDYDIVDDVLAPRADSARPEYVTQMGLRQTFGICPMPYQVTRDIGLSPKPEIALYDFMFQFDVFFMCVNFVFPGVNQAAIVHGSDIGTISDEYYVNAITGVVDIDATFEAYKQSLYGAGLQAVIDEYQAGI